MPAAFAAGALLAGRYEMTRCLADDGLTSSWLATDRVLARSVRIEALDDTASEDELVAFVASTASAARLVHPNIVATYDSGYAGSGVPYLVTELPSGTSLDTLGTDLPAARVVTIGRQAARALEAAHKAGVVHGGVGSAAVLVGEDDRVKLGGFATFGTRARLAGMPTAAGDVAELARTLAAVLAPFPPRQLAEALASAGAAGALTDAASLAAALDRIDVADRTPPVGAAAVGPRQDGPRTAAVPTTGSPVTMGTPRGRSGMIAGVAVGLLLVIGIAITAFALVQRSGVDNGANPGVTTLPGQGRGGDYPIVAGHSFNPQGDTSTENEALAPKAFDGDSSTIWSTSEYRTAAFGNLKKGTGIFVTLDKARTLHQLTVTTPNPGWAFEVFVAGSPETTLAAWGNPVSGTAPITAANEVTQVPLNAAGADVLIWITDLGAPNHSAEAGLPYRVDIAELAVR